MVLYMNPLLFSSANQRRTTQGSAMLPLSLRPSPCICICKANDVEGLSIPTSISSFSAKTTRARKTFLGTHNKKNQEEIKEEKKRKIDISDGAERKGRWEWEGKWKYR
jgi:hypothetical protein